LPDDIHVKSVCSSGWPPLISLQTDSADTRNAPIIVRHARPPEMDFGSRRPKKALITKPRNGRDGISTSMTSA
jgi:hypothetical protein